MPLGLGKGLQNSINSWVNVNSNHVVFPKGGDSSQQSDDVSHDSSSSMKGRMMNRVNHVNRDLIQKHHSNYASNSTMGSTRTGTSTSSISTQLGSIIEKSNQPRKLKRSNSQSDLIKEKLAKREQQQRNMTRRSSALSHRSSMESMGRRGSMESVASNSSAPVNTGQYVNEIAFKRQLAAQQQLQQQGSSQRSLMSKNSLSKKTSPNRSHTSSAPPPSSNQRSNSPRSNSPGLNSFKNMERRSSAPNINMSRMVQNQNISSSASVASVNSSTIMTAATPSLVQNLPAGCEHTDCDHCIHLSQRIFALEEDLEALRGNYLNTEYICKSCTRNKSMSSSASVASGRTANSRSSRHSMGTKTTRKSTTSLSENVVLAEASRRLISLTSRHKRDIERLSKEKERFQKDMHFKLKNFTMMFKDVEKESLEFKDQVEKVNKDVSVVKGERDALSSELEILKARVAMYEKQEAENEEIRRLLRENQNETLDIADRAIHERDVIIEELTARLQEATSLLERKET
ncbi:hypothetical protein CTEN210_12185 [Chaetoceros tenuissimus]|uniref:Uncharacterized protein n=1 Tax=Chaetoceros tenuissimus TaxID=426638 RepID=A0AAD3D437_9STRA|nr:hypothetical protein CTEN210_12185 [Chaetoceros tenuissimus]